MVLLREGQVQHCLIALLHADEAVLKAVDKAAAAEDQIIAARGSSVKSHAVFFADIVDVDGVAVLCRAVHFDRGACVVEDALDVSVDLFIRNVDLVRAQLDSLVIAEGHGSQALRLFRKCLRLSSCRLTGCRSRLRRRGRLCRCGRLCRSRLLCAAAAGCEEHCACSERCGKDQFRFSFSHFRFLLYFCLFRTASRVPDRYS